jgi:hypothetical protein
VIALALGLTIAALAGCGGSTKVVTVTQTTATAAEQTQATPATTTETATPQSAPTSGTTFGDGDYQVPQDVKPGTYRTREGSSGCYWQVTKDVSGDLGSIIANDNTEGPAVVTIPRSAGGFRSGNCGEWTDDLARITASKTTIGEGTYIVRTDIAPGTYRSSGGSGCYWARLRTFAGGLNAIITNNNTDTPAIVQIASADRGFTSTRCGTWRRR